MDSIPNYSYDLLIYSKSYNKSSLEFITLQLKKKQTAEFEIVDLKKITTKHILRKRMHSANIVLTHVSYFLQQFPSTEINKKSKTKDW